MNSPPQRGKHVVTTWWLLFGQLSSLMLVSNTPASSSTFLLLLSWSCIRYYKTKYKHIKYQLSQLMTKMQLKILRYHLECMTKYSDINRFVDEVRRLQTFCLWKNKQHLSLLMSVLWSCNLYKFFLLSMNHFTNFFKHVDHF